MKKALFKSILCTLLLMGCNDLLKEEKSDTLPDEVTEEAIPDSVEIRLPVVENFFWYDSLTDTKEFSWEYDSSDHSYTTTWGEESEKIWFSLLGNVAVRMKSGNELNDQYNHTAEVIAWEMDRFKRYDRYYWGDSTIPVQAFTYNEQFYRIKASTFTTVFNESSLEYEKMFGDTVYTYTYEFDANGIIHKRFTRNNLDTVVVEEIITVEKEGIYTRFTPAVLPDGDSTVTAILVDGGIPQEIKGVFSVKGNDYESPVLCEWRMGLDGHFEKYVWNQTTDDAYRSQRTFTTLKVATKDLGTPIPFPWE